MNDFIRKYCPNFCFVSADDLYRMAREHYGENVDIKIGTLKNALVRLKNKGVLVAIPDTKSNNMKKKLYLRIK